MKICPYCEQDYVWFVEINIMSDERFKLCFECYSLWKNDEPIEYGTGSTLILLMEAMGVMSVDWYEKVKTKKVKVVE